jgi:cysteine-rich repeat protein
MPRLLLTLPCCLLAACLAPASSDTTEPDPTTTTDTTTDTTGPDCETGPDLCANVCGDGMKLGDEQCDDGNTVDNTDACTDVCELAYLRRLHRPAAREVRRRQAYIDNADCEANACTRPTCGDGVHNPLVLQPPEQCDNGTNNSTLLTTTMGLHPPSDACAELG